MTDLQHKTTQNPPTMMHIAGFFPEDSRIEIFGRSETKTAYFIQNGKVKHISDLDYESLKLLEHRFNESPKAKKYLENITPVKERQLELFAFYMYGQIDGTADIEKGVLADSENFREKRDCPSLLWNAKNITIDGYILTPRELMITDMFSDDLKDEFIAMTLGIAHSTLDGLKRSLFKKVGVQTKTAYMLKASKNFVI